MAAEGSRALETSVALEGFERAVRAETLATRAHERLDRKDLVDSEMNTRLSSLEQAVARIGVKVALGAAAASLVGSIVAGAVIFKFSSQPPPAKAPIVQVHIVPTQTTGGQK